MTAPRIGVIAAAGKGRRIHPRSARVPKVMLEVAGKPLLVRNVELLRDALGIREVVLVIGHLGERDPRAARRRQRARRHAALRREPARRRRPGHAADRARTARARALRARAGRRALPRARTTPRSRGVPSPWIAVCAVHRTDDPEVIRKNYAVEMVDGRITALVEKPSSPQGALVGLRHLPLRSPDLRDGARRRRRRRAPASSSSSTSSTAWRARAARCVRSSSPATTSTSTRWTI